MHRLAALVYSLLLLLPAWPILAAKPTLTFEQSAVIASVPAGARTAWFLVAQEPRGRGTALRNRANLITDDDQDGIIRLELGRPVVPTSIWMVADLETGEYVIAAPSGVLLRQHPLPPAVLHGRSEGKAARAVRSGHLTVLMVVRPGVGAWIGKVEDGSSSDGDAVVDGNLAVLLETLQPVDGSPSAPLDFQEDDIVVFMDPLALAVHDARVVK